MRISQSADILGSRPCRDIWARYWFRVETDRFQSRRDALLRQSSVPAANARLVSSAASFSLRTQPRPHFAHHAKRDDAIFDDGASTNAPVLTPDDVETTRTPSDGRNLRVPADLIPMTSSSDVLACLEFVRAQDLNLRRTLNSYTAGDLPRNSLFMLSSLLVVLDTQ